MKRRRKPAHKLRRLRKLAEGIDHLGKRHGVPGKRIMQVVRDAHDLEASLASNRLPAMWDHPFFTELYEDIVALDSAEVVGDPSLLEANPDLLRAELESRAAACRSHAALARGQAAPESTASSTDARLTPKDLATPETLDGVHAFISGVKDSLRSRARALPGIEDQPAEAAGALNVFSEIAQIESSPTLNLVLHETPTPPAPSEWIRLLRVYGVHGRAQDAIDAADELRSDYGLEKDEAIFSALLACCADARRPDLADSVFDEMRWAGCVPSPHAWSAIIHSHVMGRQLDTAFTIMYRMVNEGFEPTLPVYTSLLTGIFHVVPRDECLTKSNDLWFAMRLASVEPDLMAYTAMIRCCVRAREIERGLNLVDEMRQRGICPNVVTYNSLLRGASIAPLWHPSRALITDEILDLMQQDEVPPNRGTFNAIIRTCASVGDVVNARAYFDEMKAHGLQPDSHTYGALLWTMAAAQALGKRHKASRFLTRPRGWPVPPRFEPSDDRTSEDKVAHLLWDVVRQDDGRKFQGFGNNLDEAFDGDDDDCSRDGSGEFVAGVEDGYQHRREIEVDSGATSNEVALTEDGKAYASSESSSQTWQRTLHQARQDAAAVIAKGRRKKASRSARDYDLDLEQVGAAVLQVELQRAFIFFFLLRFVSYPLQ